MLVLQRRWNNLDIYIQNKQPIPCIYNVKQNTNHTDRFIFYIPSTDIDLGNIEDIAVYIETDNFIQKVEHSAEEKYIRCLWSPDISQTQKAGSFDIQLKIVVGETVWRSYKALYVVSGSVDSGGEPEPTPMTGDIRGVPNFDGVIDDGIRGKAKVIEQ